MTFNFNSKMPKGPRAGEALWASFRFLLIFFGALVFFDTVWTFLIRDVTFYFSAFFLGNVFGYLLRLAFALPSLIIIIVGTFLGISKLYQIIGSFLISFILSYSFGFFWSNMIQARLWGFDVVVDAELTSIGLLIGLILASRDVFFAVCIAYLVLWRVKK